MESLFEYYDSRPNAIKSVRRLYRRNGSYWNAARALFKREPGFFVLLAAIMLVCQVAWLVVVYAVASAARNAFR